MMSVADWIATQGGAISVGVIDAMYADDPFWLERFGERGRQFAREDGGFHIRHLVTALDVERHEVMGSYARWLRTVLVARGMSTWHLADNFRRLAKALAASAPMSTAAADHALEAAVSALAYEQPTLRSWARREDELMAAWLKELGLAVSAEHRVDATTLFSFVADTVALPQARSLTGYTTYRASHPTRRGVWRVCEGKRLREALVAVVQRSLTNGERTEIMRSLDAYWPDAA